MQIQFKDNHGIGFPSRMLKKKYHKPILFFMEFSFKVYKSTLSSTVPSASHKQQNKGMLKENNYA